MAYINLKSLSIQEFIHYATEEHIPEKMIKEYYKTVGRKFSCENMPVGTSEVNEPNTSKLLLSSCDQKRVIYPEELEFGDKINANYIDGYVQKRRFICAKAPEVSTSFDFWRMVWMHRSPVIVALNDHHGPEVAAIKNEIQWEENIYLPLVRELRESEDKQINQYWGRDEGAVKMIEQFMIKTNKVVAKENYKETKLRITNTTTKEVLEVTHFACTDWAEFCSIQGSTDFYNFMKDVRTTYKEIQKELTAKKDVDSSPPIVVHCTSGTRASAVFCAMDIATSQLYEDRTISLPQTALKLQEQRPHSFDSVHDYLFYYLLMARFATLFEVGTTSVEKQM